MSEPSQEPARPRSLLQNPYLWAFLIGIVTITALRPLLRREPAPPPVLGRLPAWTLADQHGQPFGSGDLGGRPYVASFFFTRCVSICPQLIDAMSRLRQRYERAEIHDVRLVSITVDPEYDTPERLAEYAEANGVDPVRWTLVTGDPDAVRELVEGGFRLAMGGGDSDGPIVDIAHSGKLVLVDGGGAIRGYYDVLERDDRYAGYSDPIDVGVDEVFHRSRHLLRDAARD